MLNKVRSHVVQNAAAIFRPPAKLCPAIIQKNVLLETLKKVFHEALDDGDFDFLDQQWLKVSVRDLDVHWFISYQDDQLVVSEQAEHQVHFSGDLNDLVLIMGRKEDPDTLFFQRRLQIEGDTELGLEVKNLMDSVDWDALPAFLVTAIKQLANFVEQGVADSKPTTDTTHAYSN
ncbi:sterol-binding protein [Vibrio sp. qd031]|uniref:ubiquinone anaerobic biosynthesis accessory factor UbiT n=1 Tax=Vibrio sp. qd031 TaxID=1603038 RepID=UPI000A109093|nr:SCP2 sterol-binding domain-containing protein [Vibrio sp. qd031]ORT49193.1 sterol-binding protein [Vibrio sp. qd031]